MARFAFVLLGVVVLTIGLLACGGSEPAVPTLPPGVSSEGAQQPAIPSGQQSESGVPGLTQSDSSLDQAAEPPPLLRGQQAPPPPWPTFTPGPKPQSDHRLLFARTRRFYTARADGTDIQKLKLSPESPQLFGGSFKDPGRGWLGPNSRYLVYFAGQEAQLWRADLTTSENVVLADRMIPAGEEKEGQFVRILSQQNMAWSSDGTRVALVGAPDPDNVDLFIADLDTNSLTRVTQDVLREGRPHWAPNDQYLAYVSTDDSAGTSSLYVLDTQPQQSIVVDVQPIREALELSAVTNFVFDNDVTWISDTQFAFYPRTSDQGRLVGIWLYDVAADTVQPVINTQIESFTWSSEARAWAYTKSDEIGTIWILQLGATKPDVLVEGEAYAPVWAPDGKSILYSWSDPESTGWDIHLVDLDGNTRTIAQDVAMIQPDLSDLGPAGKRYWGPGGESVLFSAAGRDYGRAEQQEGYGGEAGPDLENWWLAPVGDGEPRRVTDMQKIFYLHLPLAWLAFVAFFIVFVASIGYIWRRREAFDHLAAASAELSPAISAAAFVSFISSIFIPG